MVFHNRDQDSDISTQGQLERIYRLGGFGTLFLWYSLFLISDRHISLGGAWRVLLAWRAGGRIAGRTGASLLNPGPPAWPIYLGTGPISGIAAIPLAGTGRQIHLVTTCGRAFLAAAPMSIGDQSSN